MSDQNTRPTPSADELKDLIHEALQDSMDVDWSTSVGAEHVVRALTEAGFLTRSTPSSDVAKLELQSIALKWVDASEGPPSKRGWYKVAFSGDWEQIDGHTIYEFDEYEDWAFWEPAKAHEREDFEGGYKGRWVTNSGEDTGLIAYCGPVIVPKRPLAQDKPDRPGPAFTF